MEATVVCIDNSECTRNGDFEPSRFQAQAEAVNLLAGVKTSANRENTVGVLSSATMAGKTPKVMVTPTPDLAKILGAISGIVLEGSMDLSRSAQIAQLALKHRQNKNQRQKIVVFVGSPVSEEQVRRHISINDRRCPEELFIHCWGAGCFGEGGKEAKEEQRFCGCCRFWRLCRSQQREAGSVCGSSE
jgi:hypothetical protein